MKGFALQAAKPLRRTNERTGYFFLAAVFLAAGAFLAAGFLAAGAFFAAGFADDLETAAFFAGAFLAAGFAAAFFAAGLAADVFFAAGFAAAVVFLAAGFEAVAFLAAGFADEVVFFADGAAFLVAAFAAGFFVFVVAIRSSKDCYLTEMSLTKKNKNKRNKCAELHVLKIFFFATKK